VNKAYKQLAKTNWQHKYNHHSYKKLSYCRNTRQSLLW